MWFVSKWLGTYSVFCGPTGVQYLPKLTPFMITKPYNCDERQWKILIPFGCYRRGTRQIFMGTLPILNLNCSLYFKGKSLVTQFSFSNFLPAEVAKRSQRGLKLILHSHLVWGNGEHYLKELLPPRMFSVSLPVDWEHHLYSKRWLLNILFDHHFTIFPYV